MSDPNPYQPPQTPEPVRRAQTVKRWFGVGAILLLTPLAVMIAVAAGCTASRLLPSLSHPVWDAVLSNAIPVFVPLAVLTAMMIWAAVVDCRHANVPIRRNSRTHWLLLTPVVFAVATAAGVWFAWLVVERTSQIAGGVTGAGIWLALAIFCALPTASLLAMLTIAWRAGR
jgi:hypothetical protein